MNAQDTLYWWAQNGEKRGPLSLEKLRDLVRNGTIPRSSTIWCDGWEDWRSIESIAQSLAIPAMNRAVEEAELPVVKAQSIRGGVMWAGALVVVLLGLAWMTWGGIWTDYSTAKSAIERRLTSPSTAKFPSIFSVQMSGDDKLRTFSGIVDSQNTFGAMVRTRWTVTLKDGYVDKGELLP